MGKFNEVPSNEGVYDLGDEGVHDGVWDRGDKGVYDRGDEGVYDRGDETPAAERPVYNDEIERLTSQRDTLYRSIKQTCEPEKPEVPVDYTESKFEYIAEEGTRYATAKLFEQTPDLPARTIIEVLQTHGKIVTHVIFDGQEISVRQGTEEELKNEPIGLKSMGDLTPQELQLAEQTVKTATDDMFTHDIP